MDAELAVLVAVVEKADAGTVGLREMSADVVSTDEAELVTYTSKVVVVTPEVLLEVAGSVSVLCVADTALVCAEQML